MKNSRRQTLISVLSCMIPKKMMCHAYLSRVSLIFLINAIELARKRTDHKINWILDKAGKGLEFAAEKGKTASASYVIGQMSSLLGGGGPVPGFGGAVLAHVIAPYYALKGNGARAAGAAAGMYGALSGVVIGTVIGGPIGAIIGGIVGGSALGGGTTALIRAATHPSQCKHCKGVGMVGNFYRCPECDGYGYCKGKL